MTQSLRDKVREETLREVLGVMPNPVSSEPAMHYEQRAIVAIQALIPKPDRAAELVERYRAFLNQEKPGSYDDYLMGVELLFARFLISEGIVL